MEMQIDFKGAVNRKKKGVFRSCHNINSKTIDQLNLTDNSSVLEIGFENTEHLSSLFEKFNEDYAQFVRAKKDGSLDFKNDFFNCCVTVNTVYFWKEPISHFKEIYRVLQPEGKFSLAFIEKKNGGDLPWTLVDFTFYDLNELKVFFRKTGFVNIEVKQMTEEIIGKDGKERIRDFLIVTGKK